MANKVPFYALWDKKSIFSAIGLFVFAGLFLAFFFSDRIVRNYRLQFYDGEVLGWVTSAEPVQHMTQDQEGTRVTTSRYKVEYHYEVRYRPFNRTEWVPCHPLFQEDLAKLAAGQSIPILVRYKQSDPGKAVLVSRLEIRPSD